MKNLWKRFLFICTILCFSVLAFVFAAAYEELEEIVTMEESGGVYLPGARTANPMLRSSYLSDFSYESQLENDLQYQIYQELEADSNLLAYSKAQKKRISFSESVYFESGVTTENYKNDPNYRNLMIDFAKATHAFLKDHTELFWIKAFSFSITKTDISNGYISYVRVYPVDYYDGVRDEIAPTMEKMRAFAESIQGETLYDRIRYIHDYICNLLTYASATEPGCYHTIPCAWLDTYQHYGVCEAYAKSFAYVCELAGIEAIAVTGGRRGKVDANGNIESNHMWDYVRMDDGNWYLVDCTWDDSNDVRTYRYFLKGSAATADNHVPIGCFSAEQENWYEPFQYPSLSSQDYIAVSAIQTEDLKLCEKTQKMPGAITTTPENANQGIRYRYESLDSEVASVDADGVVAGLKPGTARIRITSRKFSAVSTICTVEVTAHDFAEELSREEPSCVKEGSILWKCVNEGCEATKAEVLPVDKERHTIGDWETKTAATCVKEGLSVRKCTECGEILEEQKIPKVPAEVHLNVSSLPLTIGTSTNVLKIEEQDPNDYVVSWKSSDTSILGVGKTTGVLKGRTIGTALVTLKMKSGATAVCKVQVKKRVTTSTLSLAKTTITLKKGKTYQIPVIRKPLTATDPIYYTSSNKNLATVSASGKVTAKRTGTVKIVMKTNSKAKVTLKVVIK